jgi:hypothetical protein
LQLAGLPADPAPGVGVGILAQNQKSYAWAPRHPLRGGVKIPQKKPDSKNEVVLINKQRSVPETPNAASKCLLIAGHAGKRIRTPQKMRRKKKTTNKRK